MNTNTHCLRTPLACALLLVCAGAAAQDPATVGTDIYECKLDNEQTRVCEVTFAPGAKMGSHSHPAHVVYVIQSGTLRITDEATGKAEDHAFKAGDTVWMDPVKHHAENVGKTTLKGIVIEFRGKGDAMAGRPTMTDEPRTINEAPPDDKELMEKPPMGQPPTEQAPPADEPMKDPADPPTD